LRPKAAKVVITMMLTLSAVSTGANIAFENFKHFRTGCSHLTGSTNAESPD
jgi:hypothetical protein